MIAPKTPFAWIALLSGAAVAVTLGVVLNSAIGARDLDVRPAPEFTHRETSEWLNSEPLTLKQLKGRVVLLDFWTFDCWNCYRSFPWLKSVEERYGPQGLRVIGVHTPEFGHEKVLGNVQRKVEEFGLKHPVMVDSDMSYWRAMSNRYWPAYYLLDKRGNLRAYSVGETHAGDARAREIEAAVEKLLAEPG
ncbi:MAG: redoxin family protein [Burkholderiales bacterium]